MNKDDKNNEYVLTLSDLWGLVKKQKRKIITISSLFAVFFGLYCLTRTPSYLIEGTFKEKRKASSVLTPSLAAIFSGSGSGEENEATALMKSRRILSTVVQKLGLQATLQKAGSSHGLMRNAIDSIKVEYALFTDRKKPILPDENLPLKVEGVWFPSEVPLSMTIKFTSDSEYAVIDNRKEIGHGKLNEPFNENRFAFTLVSNSEQPLKSQEYFIHFTPLDTLTLRLSKAIRIEADRNDKNFMNIRFQDRDRHRAVAIVNALMLAYQDYAREEQNRIAGEQIVYLEKRQKEMTESLEKVMGEYAANTSADLKNIGFSSSDMAMQFLMGTQSRYKQKLLDIDLETSRLQSIPKVGYAYYDASHSNGDGLIINALLDQIRELKQYGDSIEVAIRTAPSPHSEAVEKNFLEQLASLEEIRLFSQEATTLLNNIDNTQSVPSSLALFKSTKYMVKPWQERLAQKDSEIAEADPEVQESLKIEHADLKKKFSSYLANLLHLFEVHEKIIGERLSHQQPSQTEFQGISLAIAKELYLQYNQDLQTVETQLLKTQHILEAMESPDFEISSLSTVINDSVSQDMIEKTATLALSIRDQNNRSIKEQERLKDELALQKSFLYAHLNQAIELLQLHLNLLKDKIYSLQSVTLGLIQQETSILEKHLSDYVSSRFNDLKHEHELITQHQNDLQMQMSTLPQKSLDEKLLELRLRITQSMMEEVSKLVETKNISNSLEVVQSAPIDLASPPLHPKPPRLLLFMAAGFILGSLGCISFLSLKTILGGIDATAENLTLAHQHVSGHLSQHLRNNTPLEKIQDSDLETLRRTMSFFCGKTTTDSSSGKTLLVIKGNGVDFSPQLGALMGKAGLKVLLLPISFDEPTASHELPGLIQYFNHETSAPKIIKEDNFDRIACGGISRFGNELICTEAFTSLLNRLRNDYQWILLVTHSSPGTAETENLIQRFQYAVMNINGERLQSLSRCMTNPQSEDSERTVSFVIRDQ